MYEAHVEFVNYYGCFGIFGKHQRLSWTWAKAQTQAFEWTQSRKSRIVLQLMLLFFLPIFRVSQLLLLLLLLFSSALHYPSIYINCIVFPIFCGLYLLFYVTLCISQHPIFHLPLCCSFSPLRLSLLGSLSSTHKSLRCAYYFCPATNYMSLFRSLQSSHLNEMLVLAVDVFTCWSFHVALQRNFSFNSLSQFYGFVVCCNLNIYIVVICLLTSC